jgi:hypothetical protein
MKSAKWAVLAALGLGLMVMTFEKQMRGDPSAPWAFGLLCIGEGEPAKPIDPGTLVSTRLRLLPASPAADVLMNAASAAAQISKANLEATLRPKLIELSVEEMRPLAGWLGEGRMPEPGKHEVVAGSQAPPGAPLSLAGQTLKVVGVLQPSVALLTDCYIAPAHSWMAVFFPQGDGDVRPATLVRLSAGVMRDRKQLVQVVEAFPPPRFTHLLPRVRPDRGSFLAYLTGQVLFLLGGSGLLIGVYTWLAGRTTWRLLRAPLQEIQGRPRLLWGVHLVYFGLFVAGALIIYELPDVQTIMMTGVQSQIAAKGNGPLAIAGRAYGTGNVLYAAAVTFVINFFAGSLGMITLPSMIIPGCGTLLAVLRASLWGVLLGPSENTLARLMLPHTGTLLLEGGGYILAVFFAILIPMYLFGSAPPAVPRSLKEEPSFLDDLAEPEQPSLSSRPTAWRRFLGSLLLNLKGNFLVALVLAVAACYEAVEVILTAGF